VLTRGGLWNVVGVTPSAHVLHLHNPESFFLVHSPKPSFGDLRRL
jgi:hypothetical protein